MYLFKSKLGLFEHERTMRKNNWGGAMKNEKLEYF